MNHIQQKLMTAARQDLPDDRVPYAFEKRIMARLKSVTPFDFRLVWERSLWRAAAPCVGITLLLGAWSALMPGGDISSDLSQDLENTVLAAVEADNSIDSP